MKDPLQFTSCKGQLLVKAPGKIAGRGFSLSRLEGCEVVLADNADQVTVEELVNCKVFIGPTRGSCYIRKCRQCTFTIASGQLRVLGSADCSFFIDVRSDPVIENCERVLFGQYGGWRLPALKVRDN